MDSSALTACSAWAVHGGAASAHRWLENPAAKQLYTERSSACVQLRGNQGCSSKGILFTPRGPFSSATPQLLRFALLQLAQLRGSARKRVGPSRVLQTEHVTAVVVLRGQTCKCTANR